jgi:hypothetical protein
LTSKTSDLGDVMVTPPEAALFTVIHHGLTHPPKDLPSTAARGCYGRGLATEDDCRIALTACLAQGWLQGIDEPARARIADELRAGNFIGPIYGLPPIGGVDFTRVGAEIWQSLRGKGDPTWPPFAFSDVVHTKTSRYFTTRTAALKGIEEARKCDDTTAIVGPSLIGPWRAQWWRRFAEGYRLDIDERMQWQGRPGGGGEDCWMPPLSHRGADPRCLQDLLERHNVTFTEWLLLAAMDGGGCKLASYLTQWAAESAINEYGVTATETECRSGLEACLRYGWLRVVDQQAVEEVEALLREGPTVMSVASEIGDWGEIDFTLSGANLYRMIAARWLGSLWEEDLRVWKETYREEHRYCEAVEPLRDIAQNYMTGGGIVRASKLVPLGPWCVFWWERFPRGFRLELKIGEP